MMAAMQTTALGWTLIDAPAGVLSFTYGFGGEGQANCFTARLASGGLVVVSPPAEISEEALAELTTHGAVEAIVANNGFHHLGLARWRARFPDARLFAAPGAAERIAKKSRDAGALEPLSALEPLLPDTVSIVEAPTSRCGETWARAAIEGGHAWYTSDILANMQRLPRNLVVRTIFKLTKSAPGYRVFGLAVRIILKDRRAALGAMLADVRAHPPTVIVPGHGELLSGDALAAQTEGLLSAAI